VAIISAIRWRFRERRKRRLAKRDLRKRTPESATKKRADDANVREKAASDTREVRNVRMVASSILQRIGGGRPPLFPREKSLPRLLTVASRRLYTSISIFASTLNFYSRAILIKTHLTIIDGIKWAKGDVSHSLKKGIQSSRINPLI